MLLPAVGESSPFMLCQVCVKSSQFCLCLESVWMLGYHVVNKLHLGSSLRSLSVDIHYSSGILGDRGRGKGSYLLNGSWGRGRLSYINSGHITVTARVNHEASLWPL